MKKISGSLLSLLAICCLAAPTARAEEHLRPDDQVSFDLVTEDWVKTNTAHVVVNVEAAVNSANAGSTRIEMTQAVSEIAPKADWRLTGFTHNQDQTGLDHWSAQFDARLPENQLNNLAANAKKSSKPGMQLTIQNIDFSPTMEELEAARASLRTKILKMADEQLATLNGALPGRNYRLSNINFFAEGLVPMLPMARLGMKATTLPATASATTDDASAAMERSEKLTQRAHVVCSAIAPSEIKH